MVAYPYFCHIRAEFDPVSCKYHEIILITPAILSGYNMAFTFQSKTDHTRMRVFPAT